MPGPVRCSAMRRRRDSSRGGKPDFALLTDRGRTGHHPADRGISRVFLRLRPLPMSPIRVAFYLFELAGEFHALWNKGKESPQLRFILKEDLETDDNTARILARDSLCFGEWPSDPWGETCRRDVEAITADMDQNSTNGTRRTSATGGNASGLAQGTCRRFLTNSKLSRALSQKPNRNNQLRVRQSSRPSL